MSANAVEAEVAANYDMFQRSFAEIAGAHRGEFALLRHRSIVDFYPTLKDAYAEARRRFDDELFSIQQVDDRPEDFGLWSHAAP